jgi:hypothetical protein
LAEVSFSGVCSSDIALAPVQLSGAAKTQSEMAAKNRLAGQSSGGTPNLSLIIKKEND